MKLIQKIKTVSSLDPASIDRMFELMLAHYNHVDRVKFEKDLGEKEGVLFLYDDAGLIQGFSTYCLYHLEVGGNDIHAVFSGDTILNKQAWGSSAPMQILLQLFRTCHKRYPHNLYWYLISKGHRTYLLLPLLFKSFYPAWDHVGEGPESEIIDALSELKFGSDYDRERHLIYEGADSLKEEIAFPKRTNKHIEFFLAKNPEFHKGVELPCLAAINDDNISDFAMRYYKYMI